MSRRSTSSHNRRAFTLVEMIVVVAIIGILMALTLPALSAARERSRALQCTSNLRQLGQALQAFHAANQRFPGADLPDPDSFLSTHYQLLPYLDMDTAAAELRKTRTRFLDWEWPDPPIPAAVFRCPSDRPRPGANNYRVNLGSGPHFWPPYPRLIGAYPEGGNGAFTILRGLGGGTFTDGMSRTAAFSEKLIGDERDGVFDRKRDFWYAAVPDRPDNVQPTTEEMRAICQGVSTANPVHSSIGGTTWVYAGYWATWYNHTVTPNHGGFECSVASPQEADLRTYADEGLFGASSHHRGGVNVVMMGGEWRFVANRVDLKVWRALATRAGGEVISDSDF